MKNLTIMLVAAALCGSAAVAQDAPQYINSASINYNNNILYPKDADHFTLNGIGLNYQFDYRVTESYPLYVGTGISFQYLFRHKNLVDESVIPSKPASLPLDAKLKLDMFNLTVPINVSYRVPVASNFYLTPILGLDLKIQLYGRARLDIDSPDAGIVSDYFGITPNTNVNIYDDDDTHGNALNRFQLAWHGGLRFEYSPFFLQLTYGTDFTKLHKNLGEGTFQAAVGMRF